MPIRKEYPRAFEKLWRAYPRNEAKGAAFKAFEKLDPTDEDLEFLINHIELRKRRDARWIEGRYVPHLSTWLNQARWDDEYQQIRAAPAHKPLEHRQPYNPPTPEVVEQTREQLQKLRRTLH